MSKWRLRLHHQVTGGKLQAALLIDVAAAAEMCGEAGDGVVCVGVGGAMAKFAVAVAAVDAPIAAAAVAAGCDDAVHPVAAVL